MSSIRLAISHRWILVAVLLIFPAASILAQCNLNGAWNGSYNGTYTDMGVTSPDSGSITGTFSNSTATSFNLVITHVDQAGDSETSTYVGSMSGLSISFLMTSRGAMAGFATLTPDCNSMTGSYTWSGSSGDTGAGSFTMARNGATLSLNAVTFQSATIGGTTAPQSLTLTNSGGSALKLGAPTTTPEFSATSNCGASLAAGAGCSINVTCTPAGPGVRTGTLFINDPSKTPIGTAPLTCSGVNPVGGANFVPESGWWWDKNLNGTGFFIEYGGNSGRGLFIGGFLYDGSGNDMWLVSTGPLSSATYTQKWQKAIGGQTLTGVYRNPTLTVLDDITLTFTDATHATMTRTGTTPIPLERFSFSATQTRTPPAGGAPQSGWWWAGDKLSGTGYGIEIQGSAVFVVAYVYDSSGNPVWYLATGAMTSPNRYSGQWDLYAGGPQLTSPEGDYKSHHVVSGASVPMTLSFADGSGGTLTMGSVVIPITRFQTY